MQGSEKPIPTSPLISPPPSFHLAAVTPFKHRIHLKGTACFSKRPCASTTRSPSSFLTAHGQDLPFEIEACRPLAAPEEGLRKKEKQWRCVKTAARLAWKYVPGLHHTSMVAACLQYRLQRPEFGTDTGETSSMIRKGVNCECRLCSSTEVWGWNPVVDPAPGALSPATNMETRERAAVIDLGGCEISGLE